MPDRIFRKFYLFAAWVSITYFALTPVHHQLVERLYDKGNHLVAFFILFLLFDQAFPVSPDLRKKFLILTGYGALIEVIQNFIPGRFISFADLIANTFGLLLYLSVRRIFHKLQRFHLKGRKR